MKKIALPLKNNQLSPYFEQCSEFIIFTIDKENRIERYLKKVNPQPGIYPYWLAEKGVTDIITKGIEVHSASNLNKFKINIFAGVETSDPEQLVKELLNGTIETNVILEKNKSILG